MLDKSECLFERGEDGKLIGRVVTMETLDNKPEVKIKPVTRGKLQDIFQKSKNGTDEEKAKTDAEVILNGLVEPIFTESEISDMKPNYASAIVTAIISISLGISQDKVTKSAQEVMNIEAEIKK
ncbi:MAG: hypothetical protein ACTSPI_14340 [Candidatus Heimdallarchaeaceae archaeon]